MKRLISTLVLVFAFVLGANAQSNKAEQKSNAAQAEISFEKLEHDYGRVEQGGNGVTEFKYKNTGKVPLILSKVRSSCGCTLLWLQPLLSIPASCQVAVWPYCPSVSPRHIPPPQVSVGTPCGIVPAIAVPSVAPWPQVHIPWTFAAVAQEH